VEKKDAAYLLGDVRAVRRERTPKRFGGDAERTAARVTARLTCVPLPARRASDGVSAAAAPLPYPFSSCYSAHVWRGMRANSARAAVKI